MGDRCKVKTEKTSTLFLRRRGFLFDHRPPVVSLPRPNPQWGLHRRNPKPSRDLDQGTGDTPETIVLQDSRGTGRQEGALLPRDKLGTGPPTTTRELHGNPRPSVVLLTLNTYR